MNITTRSTMVVTENVKVYRFRSDIDMLKAIRQVTNKGPSVLYCNSCGFLFLQTAEEYLQAMLADQELYKKHSGLLVRVNDITIDKSELNQEKELKELKMIADSMAAYYAAEGYPTIYDVWIRDSRHYVITYVISVVSPVDGRKYTWNNKEKYLREQNALDTIAFKVTGKNKPMTEFNFLAQDNH